jgi:hypothetical protein
VNEYVIPYGASSRATHRWLRCWCWKRVAGLTIILCIAWIATAVGRVTVTHALLIENIKLGRGDSGASRLVLDLHWWVSLRPMLESPWRTSVVLYYPNGYARAAILRPIYVKVP